MLRQWRACHAIHLPYAKSHEYIERERAARSHRRRLALACADDETLVLHFYKAARRSLGDAVKSRDMIEPLANTFALAAVGLLPVSAWKRRFDALVPASGAATHAATLAPHATHRANLLSALHNRIPRGGHEARLRAALSQCVPSSQPSNQLSEKPMALARVARGEKAAGSEKAAAARATYAALSLILEGALRCDAQQLTRELITRLRDFTAPADDASDCNLRRALGLVSRVQAPLLQRVGVLDAALLAEQEDATWRRVDADAQQVEAGGYATGSEAALLAAAELARRGEHGGSRHGCVLVEEEAAGSGGGSVLGVGFNHYVSDEQRSNGKRLIHAEVHAVADALQRHGEGPALERFPRATAWIVELLGGVGYEDAPPCPRCERMLRAVGVRAVRHTDGSGGLTYRVLGPPMPSLLAERDFFAPFGVRLTGLEDRV